MHFIRWDCSVPFGIADILHRERPARTKTTPTRIHYPYLAVGKIRINFLHVFAGSMRPGVNFLHQSVHGFANIEFHCES